MRSIGLFLFGFLCGFYITYNVWLHDYEYRIVFYGFETSQVGNTLIAKPVIQIIKKTTNDNMINWREDRPDIPVGYIKFEDPNGGFSTLKPSKK